MKKIGFAFVILSLVLVLINYHRGSDTEIHEWVESSRKPASTNDLFLGVEKVLNDLKNDSVFNPTTCPAYIGSATDFIYSLKSDFFIPKTEQENELLRTKGLELLRSLFQMRLILRERFQEFDERNQMSSACLQKVRQGIRYSRIVEEYLLDWLVLNKVIPLKTTEILENDPYFTTQNPKFPNFKIQSGDLMIIRGKSFVSAMIARIADDESNFSHLALVSEDKKGNLFVVEALIQKGIIITPLNEWRKAQDARVVLYRQRDVNLGQKAGRIMYDYAKSKLGKDGEIRYDFEMNELEHSSFFCAEVATFAYEMASEKSMILPKYKSTLSKFKNTNYPISMGIKSANLFAPYDIEFDSRFDFVAEYKFYPLLRQVRLQDAVFQSIYTWMIKDGYEFHTDLSTSAKSYLGKILRQIGFFADLMPKYMPIQTINTTAQFQTVATALENNLYLKVEQFYKKNGYLPTFSELIDLNEQFRKEDCLIHYNTGLFNSPAEMVTDVKAFKDKSKFHWFFYSKKRNCE